MAIRQEQEHQEQHYLMGELESLGLSTVRLNEFNDNTELRGLVKALKEGALTLSKSRFVTSGATIH